MKICLQQVEFKAIRTGLCFLAAAGNYYLKGTNQMGVTGSGGVLPRWKKGVHRQEVTMSQNEPYNLETKQGFHQKFLIKNMAKRHLFWQLLLFLSSRHIAFFA